MLNSEKYATPQAMLEAFECWRNGVCGCNRTSPQKGGRPLCPYKPYKDYLPCSDHERTRCFLAWMSCDYNREAVASGT